MKAALTLIALALATLVHAQEREVQISGRLMAPTGDTTHVTVWSDGDLIGEDAITHRHYALILGDRDHYTIRFRSGSRIKYCHVLLVNMDLEHIQVDVNFASSASVVIYKHKARANQYTHLNYSSRGFHSRQYDKIETE